MVGAPQGIFVPSLEWIPAAVLEKKSKMCQPIRGQGGHIGIRIDFKITTIGQVHTRNICAKFGEDPCGVF